MEYTNEMVTAGLKFNTSGGAYRNSTGEVTEVNGSQCVIRWYDGYRTYPLAHSVNNVCHCLNDGTWRVTK